MTDTMDVNLRAITEAWTPEPTLFAVSRQEFLTAYPPFVAGVRGGDEVAA